MTTAVETRTFEAETQELLSLMIHSLYTEREIFLRELISNASDALDKLRMAGLKDPSLQSADEELLIRIEVDPEAHSICVTDNGIGMSRDEITSHLGTIAKSGTRAFLDQLKKDKGGEAASLIGQFGVGFYSSFMVADRVVVESLRAGETQGVRWTSAGKGEYTLEDIDHQARGTSVTLHLKPRDEDDETWQDFTDPFVIQATVRRHSDFVEHPIRMEMEEWEGEGDDRKQVTVDKTLNSRKPLWARSPSEVNEEEYASLYKHITRDWQAPARVIHVRAEVPVEFQALLFVPAALGHSLMDPDKNKSRLSLYVRRVLIMDECEDLLPSWLRFVRGVVESSDLPLNVSRQTLQANPITQRIRKHLVSQVIKNLTTWMEEDRESYESFFAGMGSMIKEGIYFGADDDQRLSNLCVFDTADAPKRLTLQQYVDAMPDDQEKIYYVTGERKETLVASPHLEAFRAKGYDVLLLSDHVDEWMVSRLTSFGGKDLQPASQGELDFNADEERDDESSDNGEAASEHKDALEAIKEHLGKRVSDVKFSKRLTDSPAVLVAPEGAMSPAMLRMMRQMNEDMPEPPRVLELNRDHAVVRGLLAIASAELVDRGPISFEDYAELVFGQALLAEGSPLPTPTEFARRLAAFMATHATDTAG